jgi:hypothetical protein
MGAGGGVFDGLRARRRPPSSSWFRVQDSGFKVWCLGLYGGKGRLELELRRVDVRPVFCAVPRTLSSHPFRGGEQAGPWQDAKDTWLHIFCEFEVHASRPRAGQAWHGQAGMHAQEQAGGVEQGRSAGRQTAKIQEGPCREQHLKPADHAGSAGAAEGAHGSDAAVAGAVVVTACIRDGA